jgi:hypothetical protein
MGTPNRRQMTFQPGTNINAVRGGEKSILSLLKNNKKIGVPIVIAKGTKTI